MIIDHSSSNKHPHKDAGLWNSWNPWCPKLQVAMDFFTKGLNMKEGNEVLKGKLGQGRVGRLGKAQDNGDWNTIHGWTHLVYETLNSHCFGNDNEG